MLMESCAHGSGTAIIVSGHAVVGGVVVRSLFLCHHVAVPDLHPSHLYKGYYEF